MNFISKETVKTLKKRYVPGTRVILDRMEDRYAPDMTPGIVGTVTKVDDIGTIHVHWDNGHRLGVVYGIDSCHIINDEGNH